MEIDVDTKAYDEAHVPGAIAWAWNVDLCDTVRRDILSRDRFEKLMTDSGIAPDTTVVVYGDNNNWFAAWAFWQMKIYGHEDVRIMNGGRKKWLAEGREVSTRTPEIAKGPDYRASGPDLSLRAFLPQVQESARAGASLVDVRSPQEFTGEIRRLRDCRKHASGAGTSPARATSHGAGRATMTERSNRTMS